MATSGAVRLLERAASAYAWQAGAAARGLRPLPVPAQLRRHSAAAGQVRCPASKHGRDGMARTRDPPPAPGMPCQVLGTGRSVPPLERERDTECTRGGRAGTIARAVGWHSRLRAALPAIAGSTLQRLSRQHIAPCMLAQQHADMPLLACWSRDWRSTAPALIRCREGPCMHETWVQEFAAPCGRQRI